ncbi:MAG: hypothetical protein ACR2JG_04780 [Geodermatophilaceae bacterium]
MRDKRCAAFLSGDVPTGWSNAAHNVLHAVSAIAGLIIALASVDRRRDATV